jgi:hypothetical protein
MLWNYVNAFFLMKLSPFFLNYYYGYYQMVFSNSIIPSTLTSWHYTRKYIFPLFIYSFLYLSADSQWVLLIDLYLLFIIFVTNIYYDVYIVPCLVSGSPFRLNPVSFNTLQIYFKSFLIF